MGIKGFQGTSLLDFPGRIASLIFWGGCNLTCPFCHNPALVLDPGSFPDIAPQDVLAELESRLSFIDGIVATGGEPTMDPGLPAFLAEVRALGLQVKLDTNGLAPAMLEHLLGEGLVDYLAVDLKTSLSRYRELHPARVDVARLTEAVHIARASHAELEFRTTCIPQWVDHDVVHDLGELVAGAPLWVFQQYHPEHALAEACRQEPAYAPSQVRELAEVGARYAQSVKVRGV